MVWFKQWKKYFLFVFIGFLLLSSLILIISVVVGEWNQFLAKLMATFTVVVAHSLFSFLIGLRDEQDSVKEVSSTNLDILPDSSSQSQVKNKGTIAHSQLVKHDRCQNDTHFNQYTADKFAFFFNTLFVLTFCSWLINWSLIWGLLDQVVVERFYKIAFVLLYASFHVSILWALRLFSSLVMRLVKINLWVIGLNTLLHLWIIANGLVLGTLFTTISKIFIIGQIINITISVVIFILYQLIVKDYPELKKLSPFVGGQHSSYSLWGWLQWLVTLIILVNIIYIVFSPILSQLEWLFYQDFEQNLMRENQQLRPKR